MVDIGTDPTGVAPAAAYRTIRAELAKYSAELAGKPQIVVGNKIDLVSGDDVGASCLAESIGEEVLSVSAVTGMGLPTLTERLWAMVAQAKETQMEPRAEAPAPGDPGTLP